jgi:hypothetical protein
MLAVKGEQLFFADFAGNHQAGSRAVAAGDF